MGSAGHKVTTAAQWARATAGIVETAHWFGCTRVDDANEWDLGGSATKANELLDQANRELKEAAEFAPAGYAFFAVGYAFSRLDVSFALGLYCGSELIAAAARRGPPVQQRS